MYSCIKLCVSKGVCGNVAPSLFSGDVPEAAVSSGEGKNKIQALKPTHSLLTLRTASWLNTTTLQCFTPSLHTNCCTTPTLIYALPLPLWMTHMCSVYRYILYFCKHFLWGGEFIITVIPTDLMSCISSIIHGTLNFFFFTFMSILAYR